MAYIAALLIGIVIGGLLQRRAFRKEFAELTDYRKNYLWKSGWASGYGQYLLASLDGGKNWCAVERDGDAFILKGAADQAYPGLITKLDGIERLTAYVAKNGPLTLSGSQARFEKSLLENAGFRVKSGE